MLVISAILGVKMTGAIIVAPLVVVKKENIVYICRCMNEEKGILIRLERETDYPSVEHLVQEAFLTAEHSDGKEHELVARLRGCSSFIPELSLVLTVDGEIAGHIMFTEISINGRKGHLALAPLSVTPQWQRRHIGSALVKEGHNRARKLGYGLCVVLGDYRYYRRFGYRPAAEFGIVPPPGIDGRYYMAIELNPAERFTSGIVKYAEPFGL